MSLHAATIQGGQPVLDAPLPLPDGTRVQVRVEAPEQDPLLFLAEHAISTGIVDLADQHDHYIYGTPRQ